MWSHRPKGWSIKVGPAQQRGAGGLCDFDNRTIYIPLVVDDYTLFVFLHEVGHARLHKNTVKPVYVQEYEAEMFASKALRAAGFRVTRHMTISGKRYVADEINRDRVLGREIDPKIRRWATRKSRARPRVSA